MTAALPELAEGDFYYKDLGGGRFCSTIHAQGAWNVHEQHMAPASGLLADRLERHEPRADMRMARISYEILGLIPGGGFDIVTTTLRPGRTIELLQAELVSAGRVAIRATAWRMVTSDTAAVAAFEDTAIPSPGDCKPYDGASVWPGGYIRSLEMRVADGHRPGSGKVWLRTDHPLTRLGRAEPRLLVGQSKAHRRNSGHTQLDVDAIQQWPRQAREIAASRVWRAHAL